MAYIRGGQGLVGWGEAVRIEARGENRIQELATKWREVAAAATIDDQVQLPGTGLVAFGSIAFADNSSSASVLIVPKILLGVRDGRSWLTKISSDQDDLPANNPEFWLTDSEYRQNAAVQFSAGAQTADGFKRSVDAAVAAITRGELK
jgi:menaquinone-specific isochorismate synthase